MSGLMSNRVTGKAHRAVAVAGLVAATALLSGCSSLGGLGFSDNTTTGSVRSSRSGSFSQPMPSSLPSLQGGSVQVAAGPYVPPANIGGGAGSSLPPQSGPIAPQFGSVTSQDLPALPSSTSNGNTANMSAQPSFAPMAPRSAPLSPGVLPSSPPAARSLPVNSSVPMQASAAAASAGSGGVHVIESGESLYAIARRYNTTAQAIVQANGMSSPDKIFVGQRLTIPGRTGVPANDSAAKPAMVTALAAPVSTPALPANALAESPLQPVAEKAATPARPPQSAALAEPPMSGSDKFRWPLSGKVIADFAASKGTGINIEAAEGAAVRAAENGTVIYTGDGVAGYGNLVLLRHANGFVSAYAHLKSIAVKKGDTVNRGDNIGAVGMTGSVSRPQLHFELRKGATPVDPMPLLAG